VAPPFAVLALGGGFRARRFFVPISRGGRPMPLRRSLRPPASPDGHERLLLLFADTYNVEPEPLFLRLAELLPGVPVVGGGASEDGSVGEVSVFAGDAFVVTRRRRGDADRSVSEQPSGWHRASNVSARSLA